MDRREYTPTKLSQLTNPNTHNKTRLDRSGTPLDRINTPLDRNNTPHERTHTPIDRNTVPSDRNHISLDRSNIPLERSQAPLERSKILLDRSPAHLDYNRDYTHKSIGPSQMNLSKDYQTLKMQVRQMEAQNRQISNDIQRIRYQKNINENKYMQKLSYQEETVAQFQKEKNYQIQLLKIKNDEDVNKVKREYEFKLDDLQRELRSKDYHNREYSEKNSYIELKINELNKGIEILESEHVKFRQANGVLANHLNSEEFGQKRLLSITDELEKQKSQMETEIHVLLDIQADKSRTINTLSIQLRNSEATERSLHDKLSGLTDNFASLEEHIAVLKERLISNDIRNQQLENSLHTAQFQLSEKDNTASAQKELEIRLRKDLQVNQARQIRRQKQIEELIIENERLVNEINANSHKLQDRCGHPLDI